MIDHSLQNAIAPVLVKLIRSTTKNSGCPPHRSLRETVHCRKPSSPLLEGRKQREIAPWLEAVLSRFFERPGSEGFWKDSKDIGRFQVARSRVEVSPIAKRRREQRRCCSRNPTQPRSTFRL